LCSQLTDPAFIVDHPLVITACGSKRGAIESDTGAAEAEDSQVSQQSPPHEPLCADVPLAARLRKTARPGNGVISN
jgi:hypothetical protein